MGALFPALADRFARLTPHWQGLSALKLDAHEGDHYFRGLRDIGLAEERREPITRGGIACGERISYRLGKVVRP